jgi:hypothetical protein
MQPPTWDSFRDFRIFSRERYFGFDRAFVWFVLRSILKEFSFTENENENTEFFTYHQFVRTLSSSGFPSQKNQQDPKNTFEKKKKK